MESKADSAHDKIKILTDIPVSLAKEDALNFSGYSERLAQIIVDSQARFAVGIFGSWGTGKTSLMKMIKSELKEKYKDDIITLWFEAWRYDRDKYLALVPFLRQLLIELENQSKDSKKKWQRVMEGVERTLSALGESVTLSSGVDPIGSVQFDISKFKNSLKSKGSIFFGGEEIPFQEHPTGHLASAIAKLRNDTKNDKIRIVAFIDDLDRCTPEKALEVLESIKAFFDMEGMVHVIAMDSSSIDSIVKEKYGENSTVKGIDYLQKIVQLPFQLPSWKEGWDEKQIIKSVEKIITNELKGYILIDEFKKNMKLIVKAVRPNPREVKRFINNIILAQSVYDRSLSVSQLMCVQALSFREEWRDFLNIITDDKLRNILLTHYRKFKSEVDSGTLTVPTLEDISPKATGSGSIPKRSTAGDKFCSELVRISEGIDQNRSRNIDNQIEAFYTEYIKHGQELQKFLEADAGELLLSIKEMGKYRRALEATKPTTDMLKLAYSCWRFKKADKKFGRRMYAFQVIVEASNSILDKIEYVTYRLSSAWPEPNRTQTKTDRTRHFELKELAWGPSTVYADVKIEGQDDIITLSHPIVLTEEGPRLLRRLLETQG
jgi:Cdc6-like AAA superfamily ATPase